MANTYHWKINSVDCYVSQSNLQDVIYRVHWTYMAQDESGHLAKAKGDIHIPEPSTDNFVPFEELIENNVLGWITGSIDVESIKSNLDEQLNRIVNPIIVNRKLGPNPPEEEN